MAAALQAMGRLSDGESFEQLSAQVRQLALGQRRPRLHVHGPTPDPVPASASQKRQPPARPTYRLGEQVATRKAYGQALAALGAAYDDVVALDGEVGNSTYAQEFAKAHPERCFEMYIAEQQLVAAAVGLAVSGYRPFASTFAAFCSRAYDLPAHGRRIRRRHPAFRKPPSRCSHR